MDNTNWFKIAGATSPVWGSFIVTDGELANSNTHYSF